MVKRASTVPRSFPWKSFLSPFSIPQRLPSKSKTRIKHVNTHYSADRYHRPIPRIQSLPLPGPPLTCTTRCQGRSISTLTHGSRYAFISSIVLGSSKLRLQGVKSRSLRAFFSSRKYRYMHGRVPPCAIQVHVKAMPPIPARRCSSELALANWPLQKARLLINGHGKPEEVFGA